MARQRTARARQARPPSVPELVNAFCQDVPGQDDDGLCNLDLFLSVRESYLGLDPLTWRSGDLEDLLLEVCPRKVDSDPTVLRDGPAVLGRYLQWLARTRQLRGSHIGTLQAELTEVAAQFAEAMQDSSRFGMAKAVFSGLPLDAIATPEALQAAVDAFNAKPSDERAALTGDLFADMADSQGRDPIVLPPVLLADEQELRQVAATAPLVERVGALLSHLGPDGRQVTQTGALRVADAKALAVACGDERRLHRPAQWETAVRRMADLAGVTETYVLGVEAGLLDGTGSRARVAADPGAADPLAWARALADAALSVGVFVGEPPPYFQELAEAVSEAVPSLLGALYVSGEPVAVEQLAGRLADELGVEGVATLRRYLERVFARLARLGMVVELGVHVPEERRWMGDDGAVTTSVALTPLGVWWLQETLPEFGFHTPLLGALASGTARQLCSGLVGYPEDLGHAEIETWRAARGQARAAQDLAALLADPDLTCRQFAAAVLDDSAESVAAVRPLLEDPRARPYASCWLKSQSVPVPERYDDPDDALLLFVETGGMLIQDGAPELLIDTLAEVGEATEFVRQLWRVESPYTEPVLTILAFGAPREVSKAARKALHSLRSSRGARSTGP